MDDTIKNMVWEKGRKVDGFSPDVFRKDCCDAWIRRDYYNDNKNEYGWVIDHVLPISKGGDDDLINLRPMHWKNNMEKGDDYPDYFAKTKADGTVNIDKIFSCTVNKELRAKLNERYGNDENQLFGN